MCRCLFKENGLPNRILRGRPENMAKQQASVHEVVLREGAERLSVIVALVWVKASPMELRLRQRCH